jgi:hypothetical protein
MAVVAALIVASPLALWPGHTDAQADPDSDTELVERYAPVLALRPQARPCDITGEEFAPASADIVLDNPHMLLRQVGVGNPVVKAGPTAEDIFGMGKAFYIDFPGDGFKPGCIFEEDYQRYNDGRNAVVYAHIATQDGEPDKLAVQYWFFWYYNRYNNLHEGDWEGIQLMFDVGTVAEALQTRPSSIGYSQHFGGEIAGWGDSPDTKLELVDTHPVVFPALGSHASYFEPALYLGRSGSQGFGCDDTQDATRRLEPDVVLLPDEVTDPNDPLAWLMFEGLWGEQRFGAFSGATGPITKSRWSEPVDWHETLRASSVAVPGGSETTTPYIQTFCQVVGFGSRQFLTAQQNPFRVTAILGALGLVLAYVTGRTEWNPVAALPVVRRRRLGQMYTTSARFYWGHKKLFAGIGVVYGLMAAASSLLVSITALVLEPLGWFATLVTGIVGIVGQFTAMVTGGAATAEASDLLDRGEPATVKASFGGAIARLPVLLATVIRATAIVLGLAVTIVGIPWAIRQYIRYQVATPIIMFEDKTDAKAVLHESSMLVRGRSRWFHTATVIVVVQGLIVLSSAIFGLLLLILANGVPLWLYSSITAGSSALIFPISTMAVIMIYGNIKASQSDVEASQNDVEASQNDVEASRPMSTTTQD